MSDHPLKTPDSLPEDWEIARPENPPKSSLYPAALALASTLLVWGLISSLIISAAGAILFAVALAGWIRNIRHERNS